MKPTTIQNYIKAIEDRYTVDDMADDELRWMYEHFVYLRSVYGGSQHISPSGNLLAAVLKYITNHNITNQ